MNYIINRHIPFYYLYDTRGSEIYNEITQQEQYYPYRKEEEILINYASDIVDIKDDLYVDGITLVEFGAGYSLKTKIIIKELLIKYSKVTFVPIDVSESACEFSFEKYSSIPNLKVEPYVGTYDMYLAENISYPSRVIYLWLGSSIGNLPEDERLLFLDKLSIIMTFRDFLLIGFDTVYKDKSIIYKAYNDDNGVTDKFIMNILKHIKTKYNLEINEEDFKYEGIWNAELSRMEMYVKCINDTLVQGKNDKDENVTELIKSGERILIEYSHKFSTELTEKMAEKTNLIQAKIWFTSDKFFMFGMFLKNLKTQWERTDHIFKEIIGYENLQRQPIDLRNNFFFYLGHIYTFYDIKVFGLNPDERFFQLFERGRDPCVDNPESCHKHSSITNVNYPSYSEVLKYNSDLRERVLKFIKENGYTYNLMCSIEHEIMHQETLMYMVRFFNSELPISLPENYSTREKKLVKIPSRKIKQGTNETFVWDNESPEHMIEVEGFKVESLPVTWGEMDEFIRENVERLMPKLINLNTKFEIRISNNQWIEFSRGKDLPAWVSLEVARLYVDWKNTRGEKCRIMTENEYDSMISAQKYFKKGNVNFKNYHAVPVGFYEDYSEDGVGELMGNGWELTSTLLRPFDGFKPMEIYKAYSQDFFTDNHFVLKGASPFTGDTLCRPSFRNWYQHNYLFQTSKFRLIYY